MVGFFRSIRFNLLYAVLLALVFMSMDKLYALYNDYFIFDFTLNEIVRKMAFFSLFLSLIPRKKWRWFFFSIMILFSFFQYVHFAYFGKNIGAIEFYLFATNIEETFETFNTMLDMTLVPLLIVIGAFVSFVVLEKLFSRWLYRSNYWHFLVIFALFYINIKVLYVTNIKEGSLKHTDSKLLYPLTNRHSSRNFFVSLSYFIWGVVPQKFFFNSQKFPILPKPKLIDKESNRTIILVIGESLRFDVFREASRELQGLANDDHFLFKKVYSAGTVTKVSVATLINRLKYPSGLEQITKEENCLFRLAKENGYRTSFISNQGRVKLQMIKDMMCPKEIDLFLDKDNFSDYIESKGYDADIEKMLNKLKLFNQEKQLVVLQQRGSHSPYEKQYPKKIDTNKSAYVNTALYTDKILFSLLSYLKSNLSGEFVFLYVSDHGELLGEGGKKGHGHLKKEVYEVPFLFYSNNQALTSKAEMIKSHYDISNFIVSLLGYEEDKSKREIYILNSDLDGFSGYGVVDGSKLKIKGH